MLQLLTEIMKIITLDSIKNGDLIPIRDEEASAEEADAAESCGKTLKNGKEIKKGRKKAEDSAHVVALRIIGYKDNTESALRRKMKERGFEKDAIDDAVEYLKKYGYLDESRMMIAKVRSLAKNKLYGKPRITAELRRLGFSSETVASLDYDGEELCDIDFEESCRELLMKLGGEPDRRTVAYMMRYGYGMSEIKKAYSKL